VPPDIPAQKEEEQDPAAWARYGGELATWGDREGAQAAYARAGQLRAAQGLPPEPQETKLAGNLHADLGRDLEALECYLLAQQQRAACRLPADPGLELNLGNCYLRLEDYPAAEAA
jgi:hypothetical protein